MEIENVLVGIGSAIGTHFLMEFKAFILYRFDKSESRKLLKDANEVYVYYGNVNQEDERAREAELAYRKIASRFSSLKLDRRFSKHVKKFEEARAVFIQLSNSIGINQDTNIAAITKWDKLKEVLAEI